MSAVDLVAAWRRSVDGAARQCAPFPAGWINQLPADVAEELKGIASMCEESHKILSDAAVLLRDILQDRLNGASA